MVKNNLPYVTRTLQNLIKELPAVKARCSAEVLRSHLQMIAHFQKQYDRLICQQQLALNP